MASAFRWPDIGRPVACQAAETLSERGTARACRTASRNSHRPRHRHRRRIFLLLQRVLQASWRLLEPAVTLSQRLAAVDAELATAAAAAAAG